MTHEEQLTKVMPCFNYKGLLVWKLIGGYEWQGRRFKSLEEIDQHLLEIGSILNESIYKVENSGSMSCQNDTE